MAGALRKTMAYLGLSEDESDYEEDLQVTRHEEPVERPEPVPVEEAVVGRKGDREEDEGDVDEHGRPREEADLEPLAPHPAVLLRGAGWAHGGCRGPGLDGRGH